MAQAYEPGKLNGRDPEVLAFIEKTFADTSFVPSYNEICEGIGMSKGSVISDSFKRLAAAGVIVYNANGKQYLPARWRELIGAGKPDQFEEKATRYLKILKDLEKSADEANKRADEWAEKYEEGEKKADERIRLLEQDNSRLQIDNDKIRKKFNDLARNNSSLVSELAEHKKQNGGNAELERIREKTRARVQAFRERQKKPK